jgi:hypothetical protein
MQNYGVMVEQAWLTTAHYVKMDLEIKELDSV